ncbi:integrase [Burkholderia multivorans]|uniref:Integrase, catalytic region n=1 Tax=Burkholderia multivorans CGD2 TaxID=513052 RepID=B9BNR4_9BURK|nr:integrase [Burkholderia multivorans]EEE07232.1 integrase, catalytic region [Burkholderia multivorans CGD2]KVV23973.1 integrase [Burkholderia multivorans]KVZ76006.1 integrase [Burkholderia multivorans]KWA39697.1 integrase [Burkholderia multivorans]
MTDSDRDLCDDLLFEDRAPAYTLLTYVHDATSRLMMLHFAHYLINCIPATRAAATSKVSVYSQLAA